MRHRKYRFKNGRKPAHRRAMLANITCSLIQSGRIETTLAKAREVRRLTEKMITLGKKGTLAARRRAVSILGRKEAVRYLFNQLSGNYQQRQGGYTRIIKSGTRRGDAAEMCFIELVTEPLSSDLTTSQSSRETTPEPQESATE